MKFSGILCWMNVFIAFFTTINYSVSAISKLIKTNLLWNNFIFQIANWLFTKRPSRIGKILNEWLKQKKQFVSKLLAGSVIHQITLEDFWKLFSNWKFNICFQTEILQFPTKVIKNVTYECLRLELNSKEVAKKIWYEHSKIIF